MASQHEKYDRPYRRGLVLGLSLAEIFLILLFLLLVAAMNIISAANEEERKTQEVIDQMSSAVDQMSILKRELELAGIKTESPDFVTELIESIEQGRASQSVQPIIDALAEKEVTSDVIANLVEEVRNSISENSTENLSEIFEKTENELRDENRELIDKIESLGAAKGELPSCWFVVVDRAKDPEKEIKTFDVKITDSMITVLRSPSIDEIRENDPTANFGVDTYRPEYPDQYLGRPISYTEFQNVFQSFYHAGEQRQVQPYRCRFFVNLWDQTSNKDSYKARKRVVEGLFHKYDYEDDWPHDDL